MHLLISVFVVFVKCNLAAGCSARRSFLCSLCQLGLGGVLRRLCRCGSNIRVGLGLSHGRPFEREPIGVMDEAIEDGVGKGWIADHLVPSFHR
jgi:hypothetical protein